MNVCRTGGRRCPSAHDAAARAARNAQRRAKYAYERNAKGKRYQPRGADSADGDAQLGTQLPSATRIACAPPVPTTGNFVQNNSPKTDLLKVVGPKGDHYSTPRMLKKTSYNYNENQEIEVTLQRPLALLIRRESINKMGNFNFETWREALSNHYGGLVGDRLSDAIVRDGYDGIIVHGKPDATGQSDYEEVVDLREWKVTERSVGFEHGIMSNLSSDHVRKVGVYEDDEIGITVTEYEGDLIDCNQFSAKSIAGKPDWDKLNNTWAERMGLPGDFNERNLIQNRPNYDAQCVINQKYIMVGNLEIRNAEIDQARTIYYYTQNNYEEINKGIFHDASTTNEEIANLDKVIEDGCHQTRILYRGTRLSNISISEPNLGDEISFPTFQSASTNPAVAKSFTKEDADDNIVFEISTPAGVNVGGISAMYEENEVILPRGARYVVVGKYDITDTSTGGGKVVQMVAVNSRGEILDGTNHDSTPPLPNEAV